MSISDAPNSQTAKALQPRVTLDRRDEAQLPAEANENAKSRSTLICRNIIVNGHRTSMRMERQVWNAIDEIVCREQLDRNYLFTTIANRLATNESLSSAVRVFVVTYYRESSTESGHVRAGHGAIRR
jgi:predicted DNA-binding ribbon-helix-helix protein